MKGACEIIGIAGNIGAGKSIVSRILRCNGFFVYDCDSEASLLMNGYGALRAKLIEILGDSCYNDDGSLDKHYVSSKIFGDDAVRGRVNSVVHEAVRGHFLSKAMEREGKVFVESAVMSTSGLDKICREIWFVDASEETRLRRVMRRNRLSEKEVRGRMETQRMELSRLPSDKVVIIENDDDSLLLERVLRLALNDIEPINFEIPLRHDLLSCNQ